MMLSRGIARTAGRALAVKRANAALFGTASVAPKVAPVFYAANFSPRQSRKTVSSSDYGMQLVIQLGFFQLSIYFLFRRYHKC